MNKPVISIEIESENLVHTRIKVFNRGAYAGTLMVLAQDKDEIIQRLTGDASSGENSAAEK